MAGARADRALQRREGAREAAELGDPEDTPTTRSSRKIRIIAADEDSKEARITTRSMIELGIKA